MAHACVDHGEVGLQDGFLKDEVDGSLQPLFCINGQLLHLLDQLLELLRGEFVEDTPQVLEELLSLDLLRIVSGDLLLAEVARRLPRGRPPCILSLVELHATAVQQAARELPGLSSLILLGPLQSVWLKSGRPSTGIGTLTKKSLKWGRQQQQK